MLEKYKKTVAEKLAFVHGEELVEKKLKERRTLDVVVTVLAVMYSLAALLNGSRLTFCVPSAIGLECFFFVVRDVRLFKQAKDRRLKMRLELSEVLDRLAVLLDAGVTLWNAIIAISEQTMDGGAFQEELKRTVNSFCNADGYYFEPETAFEELAARCKDASVSTFVSVIVQNSRKGTSELAELLRLQAVNARNERRQIAKQLSDEASTLMLLPSALILAAVLVLVAAPAVIQFT